MHIGIIGAGPGGSVAGVCLARQGIKTTLIEKNQLPRVKLCGGALSPSSLNLFRKLDIFERIEKHAYPIERTCFVSDWGREIVVDHASNPNWIIPRSILDSALAKIAVDEGCRLHTQTTVTDLIPTDKGVTAVLGEQQLTFDAVILASGATSRFLRKRLPAIDEIRMTNLPTLMTWCEPFEHEGHRAEIIFDRAIKPYYFWVFPESNNRVNIGCVGPHGSAKPHLVAVMERLMKKRYPQIKPETLQDASYQGFPIPITYKSPAFVDHSVISIGDIGGITNPASGEGIYQAMEAGRLAAETIGHCHTKALPVTRENLTPFNEACHRSLRKSWKRSHLFLKFAATRLLPFSFELYHRLPVRKIARQLSPFV